MSSEGLKASRLYKGMCLIRTFLQNSVHIAVDRVLQPQIEKWNQPNTGVIAETWGPPSRPLIRFCIPRYTTSPTKPAWQTGIILIDPRLSFLTSRMRACIYRLHESCLRLCLWAALLQHISILRRGAHGLALPFSYVT